MIATILFWLTLNVYQTNPDNILYLNETVFPRIWGYQANASKITMAKYPWIAKVIHSTQHAFPVLCTASCIKVNIFATAAVCVYQLKIEYTRIMYQTTKLSVKAFVLPLNASKQYFDDIGLIVTDDTFRNNWQTINLLNPVRTDKNFNWMKSDSYVNPKCQYISVAFATNQRHRSAPDTKDYALYELGVYVDLRFCHIILTNDHEIKGFHVPCYYACTFEDFIAEKDDICNKYLGVEGAALLRYYDSQLTLAGVVTWGAGLFSGFQLPVGFTTPNSETFINSLTCAVLISKDPHIDPPKGHYSWECGQAILHRLSNSDETNSVVPPPKPN